MKSYHVERGAGGSRLVSTLRLLTLAVAGTVCCTHGAAPPLAASDAAPRTASAGEGRDEAQGRRAKEDGFAVAARLSIAVEDGRWSEGKGAAVTLTVENDSDEKIDLPTVPQLRLAEVGAGDGGARAAGILGRRQRHEKPEAGAAGEPATQRGGARVGAGDG